jgi:Protein of unknown function (DUF3710)
MDPRVEEELTVFRRRRETDQPDPAGDDDLDGPDELEGAPEDEPVAPDGDQPYAVAAGSRPAGPWDFHDVPPDDEVPRLDLGGILLPVPEGMEVRVEVQDEVAVAATLVDGQSQLQVHAFAAPKSSGLWAPVRAEIVDSLKSGGGSAEEVGGPFGIELRARIPAENGTEPARFIGVDGPRWFLRGLMTGAGATNPAQASGLENAFRDVVVQRGSEAMAPRDMLPLHLPRDARESPSPEEPDRSLHLPERGPEITEIQ